MFVAVAQRVDTAAVFLHVEMFAFADLDHALAAAAFAPVVSPVLHVGIGRGGTHAAVVDLLHVFPAADAQRAGDDGEAVFVGIERGAFKAHVKAHAASPSAFGIPFHAFGARKPVVGVVVAVDKGHVVLVCKGDVFVFAQQIFFARVDVGVVEEDGVVNAGGQQGFHHFAGTRRAAGVEQDFGVAVGRH